LEKDFPNSIMRQRTPSIRFEHFLAALRAVAVIALTESGSKKAGRENE
jgi:hypothetical protein